MAENFAGRYGEQDDTLTENDIKRYQVIPPNAQWKNIVARQIEAEQGYSEQQKLDAKNRLLESQDRQYLQIMEEDIRNYIESKIDLLPKGLKSVLGSIFSFGTNQYANVNADLKRAVMQGFRKYRSSKGVMVVQINLRGMFKASASATSYDKLVLLKAKRIVKLLRQSLAAANMKADVTLGKQYQSYKGLYNTNKYKFSPSARTALAKQIAKKYGTLSPAQYRQKAGRAVAASLDNQKMRLEAQIEAAKSLANTQIQSTPADNSQFRSDLNPFLRTQKPRPIFNQQAWNQLQNAQAIDEEVVRSPEMLPNNLFQQPSMQFALSDDPMVIEAQQPFVQQPQQPQKLSAKAAKAAAKKQQQFNDEQELRELQKLKQIGKAKAKPKKNM